MSGVSGRTLPLWALLLGCHGVEPEGSDLGIEVCNGRDDDGDGRVDTDDPDLQQWAYVDGDGDGYGGVRVPSCGNDGTVSVGGDCDDADAAVHPDAVESCNGADDDCDGLIDNADPSRVGVAYVDGDGDGFGAAWAGARCPRDGEAGVAGDCNDAAPAVYPGAVEQCDGHPDNDCDGIVDPQEFDGDGDGDGICSDCDDSDAARSSRKEERCNGIDDDCDGRVDQDDPSVNPYTCGAVCSDVPLRDLLAVADLDRREFDPCALDARLEGICRVHRVFERLDEGYHRDALFLFLPPGPGNDNLDVPLWAAANGFRTISLGYVNQLDVQDTCANRGDGCFGDFREETLYGTDVSPYLDIGPADSAVTRLEVLLGVLSVDDPEGWGRYLDADGHMRWDRVVVSGWSVGAGMAGMLAKNHPTKGLLLLSGPKDRLFDPEPIPSSWIRGPQLTDPCHVAGVYHVEEAFVSAPNDVLGLSWSSFGIDAEPFFYRNSVDGFEGPVLALANRVPEECRAHSMPCRDDCLDDALYPAYRTLMCGVDGEGFCTP